MTGRARGALVAAELTRHVAASPVPLGVALRAGEVVRPLDISAPRAGRIAQGTAEGAGRCGRRVGPGRRDPAHHHGAECAGSPEKPAPVRGGWVARWRLPVKSLAGHPMTPSGTCGARVLVAGTRP